MYFHNKFAASTWLQEPQALMASWNNSLTLTTCSHIIPILYDPHSLVMAIVLVVIPCCCLSIARSLTLSQLRTLPHSIFRKINKMQSNIISYINLTKFALELQNGRAYYYNFNRVTVLENLTITLIVNNLPNTGMCTSHSVISLMRHKWCITHSIILHLDLRSS